MTQLTLRGFEPELEKRLREMAARDHLSLNKAALKLMRRGAGLDSVSTQSPPIGDQLRRHAGRLPEAEAQIIDEVISESREQDKALQR